MTTLSSWDFGSRGATEAAVVALQGLCLSELMFAIPDPNGLADPEIRQLAQRQLPFEYQISRNARICDCMRRGRPQTGRAWCCGLHGRTLKSRRSQRYVGGEHGHDQGRVRTTKILGEKHAPNVPQELRTPRVHGQSSPFLVRHGGRASPHRCRRVHVVGEGVGVRTVRNTTSYVSITILAELLMHGPPRDRGQSTPLFDLHERRAKTLPAGASHVVCYPLSNSAAQIFAILTS